ncbi:MAG: AbrB/MazE/SpoVT family DNA-binding domain-containing protein [Deltaproteobacteria bacterium]|nr:MAG: AbrB/MazE/SpoVT family DNA-binding domain-containing protein [Deltaproteobacteria bacterium]
MLTKRTSKNQITIPKAIAEKFKDVEYFRVTEEGGRIILTPVTLTEANVLERVREKIKKLGISEEEVEEAVKWARGQ